MEMRIACTLPSIYQGQVDLDSLGNSDGKESACNVEDPGSIFGSGRSPGVGNGNSFPVFLSEEFHRQRSLVNYNPWGHKESDPTSD